MTIHTAARQRNARTTRCARHGKRRDGAAMAGDLVALLTKERLTPLQHVCHGGSVWLMAESAVFRDGLVVPDKGAALFRVALKTGVVDGIAGHQFGSGRSVRVMAVRAPDLAVEDRMA